MRYACSNRTGTLRLLQKGRCPPGYAKVGFNRQGPRGPRGLRGPAGPGATAVRVTSDTSTTAVQDHVVSGTGLTVTALCNAGGVGTQSALYLLDTTGSTDYTVNGSYQLAAAGAHAFWVYDGGPHPNLAGGLGLVEVDQPAAVGTNAELVLQYDTGVGSTS